MKHILLTFSFCLITSLSFGQSDYLAMASPAMTYAVDVNIYPNPATDYFKVTDNNWIKDIQVYNLAGRKVATYNYEDDKKYDVAALPKGLYLIQLRDFRGHTLSTRRISIR